MKHSMLISLCLLIVCPLFSEDVNGSIEYIGDIRILNLWGTWPEMGYAHGYLLGPDIVRSSTNTFWRWLEVCPTTQTSEHIS